MWSLKTEILTTKISPIIVNNKLAYFPFKSSFSEITIKGIDADVSPKKTLLNRYILFSKRFDKTVTDIAIPMAQPRSNFAIKGIAVFLFSLSLEKILCTLSRSFS